MLWINLAYNTSRTKAGQTLVKDKLPMCPEPLPPKVHQSQSGLGAMRMDGHHLHANTWPGVCHELEVDEQKERKQI